VSAILAIVGNGNIMPAPDAQSLVINAASEHARPNNSWVLSRILRDFKHWKDVFDRHAEEQGTLELRHGNSMMPPAEQKAPDDIRIGMLISVWHLEQESGKGKGDPVYWSGVVVIAVQLTIAMVPSILYAEWQTLLLTIAGSCLALCSGLLPQWQHEKFGVPVCTRPKDIILITGNGAREAVLIRGSRDQACIDLERLASPNREPRAKAWTLLVSIILAICWLALLITAAKPDPHTWYLLGIGVLGSAHHLFVAGMPRDPAALGIKLEYERTIVDGTVEGALWKAEEVFPHVGLALLPVLFPGRLRPRGRLLWAYARRRVEAYDAVADHTSLSSNREIARHLWDMPSYRQPSGQDSNDDIPLSGEYRKPPPNALQG
jgi:hypothetical protein